MGPRLSAGEGIDDAMFAVAASVEEHDCAQMTQCAGIIHRYYDPNTGRYLQPDPVNVGTAGAELRWEFQQFVRRKLAHSGTGVVAEMSPWFGMVGRAVPSPDEILLSPDGQYSYSRNNPLVFVDPLGLFVWCWRNLLSAGRDEFVCWDCRCGKDGSRCEYIGDYRIPDAPCIVNCFFGGPPFPPYQFGPPDDGASL